MRSVAQVWTAFKAGTYDVLTTPEDKIRVGSFKEVRLGAWGDPTCVPIEQIKLITQESPEWYGYTQNWKQFPEFRPYLMASTCSIPETIEALKLGWRTYRIKPKDAPLMDNEIQCPYEKSKKRIKCVRCPTPCNGAGPGKTQKSIVCNPGGRSAHKVFLDKGEKEWLLDQKQPMKSSA
ncbi:MAG: hypothetical protein CL793_06550 [Chloroflexi bacterium]|nr:hypothetical protein [Chloroflexota bacterium]